MVNNQISDNSFLEFFGLIAIEFQNMEKDLQQIWINSFDSQVWDIETKKFWRRTFHNNQKKCEKIWLEEGYFYHGVTSGKFILNYSPEEFLAGVRSFFSDIEAARKFRNNLFHSAPSFEMAKHGGPLIVIDMKKMGKNEAMRYLTKEYISEATCKFLTYRRSSSLLAFYSRKYARSDERQNPNINP